LTCAIRDLAAFAQFRLRPDKLRSRIDKGKAYRKFEQPQLRAYAYRKTGLDHLGCDQRLPCRHSLEDVKKFEAVLAEFVENAHSELLARYARMKTLTDDIKAELRQRYWNSKERFKCDKAELTEHSGAGYRNRDRKILTLCNLSPCNRENYAKSSDIRRRVRSVKNLQKITRL